MVKQRSKAFVAVCVILCVSVGMVAAAPAKPSAPDAFTAALEVKTSGHDGLPGKMFYDATGNRMRLDITVQGVTSETLVLYAQGSTYSIVGDQCTKGTVNGSASDLFRALQYTVYNGTVEMDGKQLDKWLFEAGNLFYLFDGSTPVVFSVANAVTYTWSAYTAGEPDASVFAVPTVCAGSGNGEGVERTRRLVEFVVGVPQKAGRQEAGASVPAVPKVPKGFQAPMDVVESGEHLVGEFFFDSVNDRTLGHMHDVRNASAFLIDLALFGEGKAYLVIGDLGCLPGTPDGHAADLFPVSTFVFNGTQVVNGKEVNRWWSEDAALFYLFDGEVPLGMYGADPSGGQRSMMFKDTKMGVPPANVFAVPKECQSAATGAHVPDVHVPRILRGWNAVDTPKRPIPTQFHGTFAVLSQGKTNLGKLWFDAPKNRLRWDFVQGAPTTALFLYDVPIIYFASNGGCENVTVAGSAASLFAPMATAAYEGTAWVHGRLLTKWVSTEYGTLTYYFDLSKPARLDIDGVLTYVFSNVEEGPGDESVWKVPEACLDAGIGTEAVGSAVHLLPPMLF